MYSAVLFQFIFSMGLLFESCKYRIGSSQVVDPGLDHAIHFTHFTLPSKVAWSLSYAHFIMKGPKLFLDYKPKSSNSWNDDVLGFH